MNDKAFFDTNVLVYAFNKGEPEKGAIARELICEFGTEGNLVLHHPGLAGILCYRY